jgi:hypothetical protein
MFFLFLNEVKLLNTDTCMEITISVFRSSCSTGLCDPFIASRASYDDLRQQLVVTRYKRATLRPSSFKTNILCRTCTNTSQYFMFNVRMNAPQLTAHTSAHVTKSPIKLFIAVYSN